MQSSEAQVSEIVTEESEAGTEVSETEESKSTDDLPEVKEAATLTTVNDKETVTEETEGTEGERS